MGRKRAKDAKAPERLRLHLSLPADVHRRLCAYAGWHHLDVCDVVVAAVMTHMRGFRVSQADAEATEAQGAAVRLAPATAASADVA